MSRREKCGEVHRTEGAKRSSQAGVVGRHECDGYDGALRGWNLSQSMANTRSCSRQCGTKWWSAHAATIH